MKIATRQELTQIGLRTEKTTGKDDQKRQSEDSDEVEGWK
jgi:hypothetical protein